MKNPHVQALFAMYLAGRKIRGRYKHKNEDVMLQATTFMLLSTGKLTVSQLSEKLFTKVSAISEKVLFMEKEGYVKKTKEKDGRESYIELTAKGRERYEELADAVEEHCTVIMNKVSPEEMKVFLSVLRKIGE